MSTLCMAWWLPPGGAWAADLAPTAGAGCPAGNDKLIKEAQVVWIKYTRSRAERYTHDT
jgi:hypothetical protein